MFQFKINHHILRTCDKLLTIRPKLLTVTSSYHVCELKQTVEHLFEECQHAHSFWNLFTSSWNLTDNDKIYEYISTWEKILPYV